MFYDTLYKLEKEQLLTEDEYIYEQENLLDSFTFRNKLTNKPLLNEGGIYNIHDIKSSKYNNKDIDEELKREFEEKWY